MHLHRRALLVLVPLLGLSLSSCSTCPNRLPGGLCLEEHALAAAPELDPLTFAPLQGSQQEVLAVHEAERARRLPDNVTTVDGNPTRSAPWEGGNLVAVLLTSQGDPPEQTVEVSSGDQVIFRAPAGLPSPALPLQGLWTYDRHWALEILLSAPDVWAGQIYIDGALVNQAQNYDEAFGFQLLAGKPFFFFSRQGHVGISYDGQEADLGYDQVSHYQCCSGSAMNPIQAENMVAFFAMRGDTWYYSEIGSFK